MRKARLSQAKLQPSSHKWRKVGTVPHKGDCPHSNYGAVVESVNVSVVEYAPVRSGSFAAIGCLKPIANSSLETGPVQLDFSGVTSSGEASENAPLVRWPGETDSAASPAVDVTVALVCAV